MANLKTTTALVSLSVVLSPVVASAATVSFDNPTPVTIVDNTAVPFEIDIVVLGITDVVDVDVSLLGISHAWIGDLQISLQGPTGATAVLLESPTGIGDLADFIDADITFSDGAGAIPNDTATFIPSGTYSPTSYTGGTSDPSVSLTTLNVFNGLDPNGIWTLSVHDDTAGQDGSITGGVRLSFDATDVIGAAVPLPAALPLSLGGIAALGAVASRRRRKQKPVA